jgi:DNA ligase 1
MTDPGGPDHGPVPDSGLSGFADLVDGLSYAGGRNAKLKLMADWLRATPDPDRGWGLAALTGGLDLPGVKPALIRALIEDRVDPLLFRLSYDYVGDLAETVSLLWQGRADGAPPGLAETVERLRSLGRAEAPAALSALLDQLDAPARYALLKLPRETCVSAPARASPGSPSPRPSG